MMLAKVLIVEDNELLALGMTDVLAFAGFEILGTANRVSEAIAMAERNCPTVAVIAIHLAGRRDGVEGANILKNMGAEVVFVSTEWGDETLARARALEPAALLSKPSPRELLSAVQKASRAGQLGQI
jgi:two-component system, response regulator PdtaR